MLHKIDLPMDKIKEMFENGYSAREIADLYYVSVGTIYKRFEQLGLSASKRSRDKIEYVKQKVRELYNNNDITIRELAEQLGVQETEIYRHAREMKIIRKRRVQYIRDVIKKETFEKVYNGCETYKEVAKHFNISVSSVRTLAIKLGIPTKPYKSTRHLETKRNKETTTKTDM